MLESKACVKCGSGDPVIPARVMDRGDNSSEEDLRLRVDADPEAFIFKNAHYSPLVARVYSRCGYTEFYAADTALLRDAWQLAEGLDKG
jgi:predicted nucleic-acid-binding Zn-ribbon protein